MPPLQDGHATMSRSTRPGHRALLVDCAWLTALCPQGLRARVCAHSTPAPGSGSQETALMEGALQGALGQDTGLTV